MLSPPPADRIDRCSLCIVLVACCLLLVACCLLSLLLLLFVCFCCLLFFNWIAPLGSMTLVANAYLAPLMLGETLTKRDFFATVGIIVYELLCFALLCFALLCFALLCFALLCFALLCFVCFSVSFSSANSHSALFVYLLGVCSFFLFRSGAVLSVAFASHEEASRRPAFYFVIVFVSCCFLPT